MLAQCCQQIISCIWQARVVFRTHVCELDGALDCVVYLHPVSMAFSPCSCCYSLLHDMPNAQWCLPASRHTPNDEI